MERKTPSPVGAKAFERTWTLLATSYVVVRRSRYQIPVGVADIARRRRTDYKGGAVTKAQLVAVLNDLQRLLVRAKFHTDQIEAVYELSLDSRKKTPVVKNY